MAKAILSCLVISAALLQAYGYRASTTRFTGDKGSCGGCSLNLVGPLGNWAAAATPQSMQEPYDCPNGGCPRCLCATGKGAASRGQVAAGCGSCFRAKTTGSNPWTGGQPVKDFNIVVVDSCPYDNNREWCPRNVGENNAHGFQYHFDLVEGDVNKMGLGDNPIIDFDPIACPQEVLDVMTRSCCGVWWQDQGCPRRNEGGITFGTCATGQYKCPP